MVATVSGKAATASIGTVAPAMFGTTTLQLYETRVVETTKLIIAGRDSELLLSELDSAELTTKGNPLWLLLGILTLWLFGIGLIFIIVYFFAKHRFLIVRSMSNVQIVGIKGDEQPYRDFMAAALAAGERLKGLPARSA